MLLKVLMVRGFAAGLACAQTTVAPQRHSPGHSIFEEDGQDPSKPPTLNEPLRQQVPASRPSHISRPAQIATKSPVPAEAARHSAERMIDEIYASQYRDTSQGARRVLASLLMGQAQKDSNAIERYVLLRRSANAAAMGGDVDAMRRAIGEIVAGFDTDGSAERLEAYQKLAQTAPMEAGAAALDAGRRVIDAERFDMAGSFLDLAAKSIDRRMDPALASGVATAQAELARRQTLYQQYEAAMKKVRSDPAARGVVGRYLCFRRGDWENGVPYLAGSDDHRVHDVAAMEIGHPVSAGSQMALADQWWQARVQFDSRTAIQIAAHAADWYERAASGLSGLSKALAQKRASEARAAAAMADSLSDTAGTAAKPMSIIFVCDATGSMLGEPFERLRVELCAAIDLLGPTQRFNIVVFQQNKASAFSMTPAPADQHRKAAAEKWMDGILVGGSGSPIPGLRMAWSEHVESIYLLTDGSFNDDEAILAEVRRRISSRTTPAINTIAVYTPSTPQADQRTYHDILDRIARMTGGRFKGPSSASSPGRRVPVSGNANPGLPMP